MSEIKLFNIWSVEGITIEDKGLKQSVSLQPIIVPRTLGRYAEHRFYKSKANVIERLINKIMTPGHKGKKHFLSSRTVTGKGHTAYNIVKKVFEIIEKEMKLNPVKVFVKALENAAPREEITSIEYGGARYPQAVECSPQRRIDLTLKNMIQGSFQKSFNKKIKFEKALADEIMNAYASSQNSQAISKKLELERQADASR